MFPRRLLRTLLALLLASPALRAGEYHDGPTLNCSECHLMHPGPAKRGAAFATPRAGGAESTPAGDVGPLLKRDINDLCLACHDDSSIAPDVLGDNRGRFPDGARQAGHLNRLGGNGRPGTGHTLGSSEAAPGARPPWRADAEDRPGQGLTCIDCHAPHGSRGRAPAYRNLRADAGNNRGTAGLVTYNREQLGANDLSRDVFVRRAHGYDESAVDFNEPKSSDSGMARFCAGCHGDFHGAPASATVGGHPQGNSYAAFLRHPAAGVDVGAAGDPWSSLKRFAAHASRVKVMSAAGVWNPPGADVTPTCITCHKAHGNGNAFGLILRSGRGVPTEDGDAGGTQLEHLCGQCHEQAEAWSSVSS